MTHNAPQLAAGPEVRVNVAGLGRKFCLLTANVQQLSRIPKDQDICEAGLVASRLLAVMLLFLNNL